MFNLLKGNFSFTSAHLLIQTFTEHQLPANLWAMVHGNQKYKVKIRSGGTGLSTRMPTLWRQQQRDNEFKDSLNYMTTPLPLCVWGGGGGKPSYNLILDSWSEAIRASEGLQKARSWRPLNTQSRELGSTSELVKESKPKACLGRWSQTPSPPRWLQMRPEGQQGMLLSGLCKNGSSLAPYFTIKQSKYQVLSDLLIS